MKAIASLLLLTAVHASAAFTFDLPGNSETGSWSNLYFHATNHPTPPALNSLIAASGSSAAFTNDTGTATYTSTGSGVYGGQTPNEYSVVDNSPILDLATVIFQARTNLDFTSITLTLNGATTGPLAGIVPAFALSELSPEAGRFDRAWQWDLSGISAEITSYEISITTAAHTVLYATSPLTVQTSDSFVQVVPEPTTGLLAIAPLALVVLRRRRSA